MSITVNWDNTEKTRLRYDLQGATGWTQFRRTLQLGHAMMRSLGQQVDVIISVRCGAVLPQELPQYISELLPQMPANQGCIVFASRDSAVTKVMAGIYRQCMDAGYPLLLAGSVEQARAVLELSRRRYQPAAVS